MCRVSEAMSASAISCADASAAAICAALKCRRHGIEVERDEHAVCEEDEEQRRRLDRSRRDEGVAYRLMAACRGVVGSEKGRV